MKSLSFKSSVRQVGDVNFLHSRGFIRIPIASGRGQEGTQVREPMVRQREESSRITSLNQVVSDDFLVVGIVSQLLAAWSFSVGVIEFPLYSLPVEVVCRILRI